jgi:hypothetical protein
MKFLLAFSLSLFFYTATTRAQQSTKTYFREETSDQQSDAGYGKLVISTEKGETKVIEYVMAYGEGVRALTVRLNNGFIYKLAPVPSGENLNYVGSSLDIVLKDGDKATIEFNPLNTARKQAERHIYLSGYSIK